MNSFSLVILYTDVHVRVFLLFLDQIVSSRQDGINHDQLFRNQLDLLLLFTNKYFSSDQMSPLNLLQRTSFFKFILRVFRVFSRTKKTSW